MKELEHLVRQARRRLWLNRWLAKLGWTLTVSAGAFIVVVVALRAFRGDHGTSASLYALVAAGALLAACAAACIWSWVTRESLATAAAHLDMAAGLKERVSSALYCTTASLDAQEAPFASAVVVDAVQAVAYVEPREHLPVRWPRSAQWAGGSMLAAILVLGLFPEIDLNRQVQGRQVQQERTEAVQRAEAEVRPMLDAAYQDIARALPDITPELAKADPLENARFDSPSEVRRTAMMQVDRLSEQLQKRRDVDAMARVEEFKRMMRRLAGQATQPTEAGRLAGALARGDLASAREALEEMRKQLDGAPQSEQEQQRLEELKAQLKELSEKLAEMAENDQKIAERLKAAGLSEEACQKALESIERGDLESLEKQLTEAGLSEEQARQLVQQINCRLGACAGAWGLAQGLGALTAGGLADAEALLMQMQELEGQLSSLNGALADLEAIRAKLGTSCTACEGTGMCQGASCGSCGGTGSGVGWGIGLGAGPRRSGESFEQKEAFQTAQHRAPVPINRQGFIMQRFINGQQYRGEVTDEFVETALSAERDVTDAIARERIPRVYHGPVRNYFTRFRESLPEQAGERSAPPDGQEP